jgi:hypothetical protein
MRNRNYNACLVIDSSTRDELKKLGMKGQTYDDIIKELIKHSYPDLHIE